MGYVNHIDSMFTALGTLSTFSVPDTLSSAGGSGSDPSSGRISKPGGNDASGDLLWCTSENV